jgi:hypothetical protein
VPPVEARTSSGTTLALVGAGLDLFVAVGIGVFRWRHGSIGQNRAEGVLPTLAIAAALAAPGVLALIGVVTRRPALFGAAGVACFPLVLVSVIAVPIWIASGFLIAAFARSTNARSRISGLDAFVFAGFALPIVAGLWILITETRQYTYNFAGGGSEGGDSFTRGNAVLCIAIVVADLLVATLLTTPTRRLVSEPTSQSACDS